jgi:hypothetical protein
MNPFRVEGLRHNSQPERDGRNPLPNYTLPEPTETVRKFRFVPESYLSTCQVRCDPGAEYLLYVRTLINEEEEA